jgi:hypothetical protein
MTLFEYLCPSRTRRALLRVLRSRKRAWTVQQLAQAAEVSYSNAHGEVGSMSRLGLVQTEKLGHAVLCAWNADSKEARALEPLLRAAEDEKGGLPGDDTLYWNLRQMGAPLASAGGKGSPLGKEETLAYALGLSRRHPEVARVWPVVYARHREELDHEMLARLAGRLGQKRALGFFLDLTQVLLGRDAPRARNRLRDARFRKTQDFFVTEPGERSRELAELRTPEVARRWHFRMNMPLESFKTSFDKFAAKAR